MRTNPDWQTVAELVIPSLIVIHVYVFDTISNSSRSRLIGRDT